MNRKVTLNKKNIFLGTFILSQLFIISFLIFTIYQKQKGRTLGSAVNPVAKESINFSPDNRFKYFYELDPDAKLVFPKGILYADYRINSEGFNERLEYEITKPKDTFRIITLGDSWTFGGGVATKDNYSEVLEVMLNKNSPFPKWKSYEVINLGLYGYDLAYSVEKFRRRGQKYNPDLIIWLLQSHNFTWAPEYIHEKVVSYIYKGKLPPSRIEWEKATPEIWKKALEDLIKEKKEEILKYEESALYEMNNYYNNKLVFLLLTIDDKEKEILRKFSESRKGVSFIQRKESLNPDETLEGDRHPNQKGHQILAQELYEFIVGNNLIGENGVNH